MKLVDSHAHLDMLKDPAQALRLARENHIAQVVTIGIDLESSLRAAELTREHVGVFCTVGLHPHDAGKASVGLWSELKRLALTAPAVAVGECGLDYYRDRSPRTTQREVFARQVELALELGLPLVVHDREAHADVLGILKESGAERVGGVVHCFSGDRRFARQVLDLGFMIGVPGTITYKNNQQLREVVKSVPLKKLLIETDCPFLSPEPLRGKPNQPAYLHHTLTALAKVLGQDPEEVAAVTADNARRLFGLPLLDR